MRLAEGEIQCAYCHRPASCVVTTSQNGVSGKAGDGDVRAMCEEHEMRGRLDALRRIPATREGGGDG